MKAFFIRSISILPTFALLLATGCHHAAAPAGGGFALPPGGLPVQALTATDTPVPQGDTYVSTIKSRRSATMTPQVDGNLVSIAVRSGDHVRAGQVLMQIDPIHQQATLESAQATEAQKLAVYEYNETEVERQRKLFEAGITSRDAYDQALQSFRNSKADYNSSVATSSTQKRQLAYYRIVAPFDGIVGDVPVHIGDYVSSTTQLTTVDANTNLEVYVYVPADHASQLHMGLPVQILGPDGSVIESSKIDFLSPQVDNGLQGILVKAPIKSSTDEVLRTQQLVKARVIWSSKPMPTIPVLAVTRLGGQNFIYVAQKGPNGQYVAHQKSVVLGDTVNNNYAVESGLQPGEKVILSGLQFLAEGVPVHPLG